MEHDYSFLPHFLTEEIYLINEKQTPDTEGSKSSPEKTVSEEKAETTSQISIKTMGANLKNCLIIVADPGNDTINPTEKGFLESILKSVKFQLEDTLTVNVEEVSNESIEALLAEQNHRWLIDFGTNRIRSLSNNDPYKPILVGNKKYLKANTLTIISQDVEKKKMLWAALQEMFLNQ